MIVAFLVWVFLISGLYFFGHFMASYANALAEQGAELTLWQRLLFGLAIFWGRFGWLLSPLLLFGSLGVAALFLIWKKSAKPV